MATYTGVADENGDFTVPFSSNYTSGQKVIVTAEKDGAEKTIELYAPSEVVGGGNIRFTGNVNNFPANIGGVELHDFSGTISGFNVAAFAGNATSLYIGDGPVAVSGSCFLNWSKITSLQTPATLNTIGVSSFSGLRELINVGDINKVLQNLTQTVIPNSAFFQADKASGHLIIPDHITEIGMQSMHALSKVSKLTLGLALSKIGTQSFGTFSSCDEIICKRTTPPVIDSSSFVNLKATCVFKVPAASLATYQSATNWSAFAGRMVGV